MKEIIINDAWKKDWNVKSDFKKKVRKRKWNKERGSERERERKIEESETVRERERGEREIVRREKYCFLPTFFFFCFE